MMKSKESNKIYQLPMDTLRQGFSMHCRLLGIRKDTCLALILMLYSKELLIAMLYFMAKIEKIGLQEGMDRDDITTIVVETAAEMREAWDRKNNK